MMKDEKTLCGTVDEFEQGWARLALDDGQRLDWPRDRLPSDASEGKAFVLSLERGELSAQEHAGTWHGTIGIQGQTMRPGTVVSLGQQSLVWPAIEGVEAGDPVTIQMDIDHEDTARRQAEVKDLISDLFG
jgi:hypothetical protein